MYTDIRKNATPLSKFSLFLSFVLFLGGYLLIHLLTADVSFFGNSIYYSQQARWFFQNGIDQPVIPTPLYTGNPSVFSLYLACFWKLFGKTLLISHLAMLPFVIGIAWQLFLLTKRFIPHKYIPVALLLLLIEPTVMSQVTIISKGIVIIFFYLFALNQLFRKNLILFTLALTGLIFTNIIGMILVISILFSDLIISTSVLKDIHFFKTKNLAPYMIITGIIIGWITFSFFIQNRPPYTIPDFNATHEFASFKQILLNDLRVDRNLFNFGRISVWVFIVIYFIRWGLGNIHLHDTVRILLIMTIIPIVILELSLMFYTVEIKTRFFAVTYLLGILLFMSMVSYIENPFMINKKFALRISVLLLLTGHFWIFNPGFSQDWDSSMAYLPYVKVSDNFNKWLNNSPVKASEIMSPMPYKFRKATYLDENLKNFAHFSDSTQKQYLYISNVMERYPELNKSPEWQSIENFEFWWIKARLLKKQ